MRPEVEVGLIVANLEVFKPEEIEADLVGFTVSNLSPALVRRISCRWNIPGGALLTEARRADL